MPVPEHQDESVVSGRPPGAMLAWVVCGAVLIGAGAGVSWAVGADWPFFVAAALLSILAAPAVLARWRHRVDFANLRQARRRVAEAYDSPLELRSMVGTTPTALRRVVQARCEAADRDGVTLFIEMEEGDAMEQAWQEEGFEEVEHVDTSDWGRFSLLVRRPRS